MRDAVGESVSPAGPLARLRENLSPGATGAADLTDVRGEATATLTVERIAGFGNTRDVVEQQLDLAGVPLPLAQRAEWQACFGVNDTLLLVARTKDGRIAGGLSAAIGSSRALPGHRIYRVERFGASANLSVTVRLLEELCSVARNSSRCLRVVVDMFDRDAATQERLAVALQRAGFKRSASSRMYQHTLGVDLEPNLADIFARLHSTARKNIRAPEKRGFELREIVDPDFGEQVRSLTDAALRRTGGQQPGRPWEHIITLSAKRPRHSRLAGLFDPRAPKDSSLVAFAWGIANGTYASYEAAGSLRGGSVGNTSLGYAPMWDVISWARERTTAQWVDLGGVSGGAADDPCAGITEFKRYFSSNALVVGGEWRLEPDPVKAAIARAVAEAAAWVTRTSGGFRRVDA
jgi:hypothetical protein